MFRLLGFEFVWFYGMFCMMLVTENVEVANSRLFRLMGCGDNLLIWLLKWFLEYGYRWDGMG